MRILYLTPTDVFSGGERVTRDIAREMAQRGHEVVYCGIEGPVRQAVEAVGVEFFALDGFTPASVRAAVKAWKPDLIHTMDFRASTYAALVGVPFLAHLHNNPLWLKGLGANVWAMLFFGCRAAHILTVSDSVMDEYRFGALFKKKTTVLGNIVDTAAVREAAKQPLPSDIPADAGYDLLFFARLTEQKQPLTFLRIVSLLKERMPKLSALMIGEGELRPAVEAEIARLDLSDTVTMAGYRENPFPLAARAKLLLMPSAWEGFGLTAVESMALGLPVLGTPVGGLQNILSGNCGGICADAEAFVSRAEQLLTDPAAYEAASAAARVRAEDYADKTAYYDTIERAARAAIGRE